MLAMLIALAALLAGTWWAYHPGLAGGFLFDDFANLPVLGATGPVDDWATFWRYITAGDADPTGRPLALLSFLIDARNWPADPRPFLRTGVILHLVNGALLFGLLRYLGCVLAGSARPTGVLAGIACPASASPSSDQGLRWRINLAALLGAAFWLLHPLFVSTTLYIVQREAMLPATFVLVGLMLWLRGRSRMLDGHTGAGLAWMVLGLGGCTVLGVLSKANGILLPALALTVEYTVLRYGVMPGEYADTAPNPVIPAKAGIHFQPGEKTPMDSGFRRNDDEAGGNVEARAGVEAGTDVEVRSSREASDDVGISDISRTDADKAARRYRWALVVLAWLPACLVAAYLLHVGWNGFVHGTGRRPWTLGQRLLTEPRVLIDYLQLLWLPRPFTPGLFNDQIHASVSLINPWTTLPCLLAVLGLIVGALVVRKRWPALALAVLFYFVGQALESSTVALELYYEHRNYLPAMLMFWPLALWLCGVPQRMRTVVGAGHARDRTRDERGPGEDRSRAWPAPTKASGRSIVVGKALLAVALLAGLAAMTHARANVWGNTREQALLWARLNPTSPRAQANAALSQLHAGHPRRAAMHLRGLLQRQPDQIQLALNLFAAECRMGYVRDATMDASTTALATTSDPGAMLIKWFGRAIAQTSNPTCPQLTLGTIEQLLAAAKSNATLMASDGRRQDIIYLEGRIALQRGQPDRALADFKRALDQNVRATAAFQQAAVLGSQGYPRRGLALLHYYETDARQDTATPAFGMPRVHAWVLRREHYWQHELRYLRHTLRNDAATRAAKP